MLRKLFLRPQGAVAVGRGIFPPVPVCCPQRDSSGGAPNVGVDYRTVLGTRAGAIVGRINSYAVLHGITLPADLASIARAYGVTATAWGLSNTPIVGLAGDYGGFQDALTAFKSTLAGLVDSTVTDADTVASQLPGLTQTDLASVLAAIIKDMDDRGITVVGSDVEVSAVQPGSGSFAGLGLPFGLFTGGTAGPANNGNGTAVVDTVLDGWNPPLAGAAAHRNYSGKLSQLAVPSEVMTLTCVADSFRDGVPEGGEQWSWAGGPKYAEFDYHNEGSGDGPGVTTANGDPTVSNRDFTSWSGNTPSGWTIVSGTAGTHIFKQTGTAYVYRGSASLKFVGDGSTNPQIAQGISASLIQPRRRYHLGFRAFRDGTAPTAGSLQLLLSGTGMAPQALWYDAARLTRDWTLISCWWTAPDVVPDDLTLYLGVANALTSGTNVYVSSLHFKPVDYHGGVSVAVIAGSKPWTRGDQIQFGVSNREGKWQQFARRHWQVQLPSVRTDVSGSYAGLGLPFGLFTAAAAATIAEPA